jgi:hypothetical protein
MFKTLLLTCATLAMTACEPQEAPKTEANKAQEKTDGQISESPTSDQSSNDKASG